MAEIMPIAQRIGQHSLTRQELMTFARSAAQALARIHEQELAFGDLSIETVRIDPHSLAILPYSSQRPEPLDLHQKADLRSMGEVLYFAACGHVPPPQPEARPPQVSQELWLVITRLLTDDLDRIRSARELTVTVEALAQMRMAPEPDSGQSPDSRKARQYVILAAIALLMLIFWVILMVEAPSR